MFSSRLVHVSSRFVHVVAFCSVPSVFCSVPSGRSSPASLPVGVFCSVLESFLVVLCSVCSYPGRRQPLVESLLSQMRVEQLSRSSPSPPPSSHTHGPLLPNQDIHAQPV